MVESIRMAKKQGLAVRTNLIIGFPHETRMDVIQTLWFGVRMSLIGVDEAPYFIFSAYPGTEIFAGLMRDKVVALNDDYFMSLVSFNGKFSTLWPRGVTNRNITAFELATSRVTFMLINYGISYLLFPKRLVRTFSNTLSGKTSATVFENRLQDALHRRKTPEPSEATVSRVSS
jgi:radical SAM superfamily enzyme YgiQ (UPF0313 family)